MNLTPVAKPKKEEKKSLADIVKEEGVPQSIYLGWIRKELDEENSCLELPFTIMLLISFSILAIMHLGQADVFTVEEAIELDIVENANFAWAHFFGHKGIFDANSIGDFWSWFRLGFLPLVVQPSWGYAESFDGADILPSSWKFPDYVRPAPIRNDYLRYSRMVGGIRLRQEVAEASMEACRFPSNFDAQTIQEFYGKPCAPSSAGELTVEAPEAEQFGKAERTQWMLPLLQPIEKLLSIAVDMEDGCSQLQAKGRAKCFCDWCAEQPYPQPWIDEQTVRVEISFILFNPQYGIYSAIGVNFFFNRAGHIHKFVSVQSAWADPFSQPMAHLAFMLFADAVWLLSLLYVLIGETREVISVIRGSKDRFYKSLWDDYIGIWNMVDWISILIAFMVVLFYMFLYMELADVNEAFVILMRSSVEKESQEKYMAANLSFFEKVDNMMGSERRFRMSLCIYPMIVMLRLFKSFAAQPRLAVVTATLTHAGQDMLHFFIVFMSVYVCMAVNSVLFFGQDVEEFSTIDRAIHTCFRAMFGDWDWPSMQEIGRVQAGVWFWIFMMIMVIILLNMLLAILMDAYTAVKESAANAQTLIQQIKEMDRRRKQYKRGERVRLTDVWNWFEADANGDVKAVLSNDRSITADFLVSNVPRMKLNQAKRTLENSLKAKQEAETAPVGDGDLKEPLTNISKRAQIIQADVTYTKERIDFYDNLDLSLDEFAGYALPNGCGDLSDGALKTQIDRTVGDLSMEMATVLGKEMSRLERRQEDLEQQQDQMHGMLNEMQGMLLQQLRVMGDISQNTRSFSPRSVPNGQVMNGVA